MKQHLDGHNGPAVLGALIDWRRLCDGAQPGKGRASDAESGRGVWRSDVRPLKRQTSERRSSWAEAVVLGLAQVPRYYGRRPWPVHWWSGVQAEWYMEATGTV